MYKSFARQEGFTLLELLVVISIISILSVVAIPKFNNAIILANTTKIQNDLQTLDTAIVLYETQNGKVPANLYNNLEEYIVDIKKLKPPQGKCLLRTGEIVDIVATEYSLETGGKRALCGAYTVGDVGRPSAPVAE